MNFIRNEALKIETNINANINVNIRFKPKKSKFKSSKYIEKNYSNINTINNSKINFFNFNKIFPIINLEDNITTNKLIKWHNYSCRYDVFFKLILFYIF